MDERRLTALIAAAAPEYRAALRDVLLRDPAARYVVIEAESGARALELCRERSPDCLILDYDLPDLSGLEWLKRLAAEDETPACAVVMLVGAGAAQLAVEAMKSGAHYCLEKNRVNEETLLRAVSYAIEKADQQRQITVRERALVEWSVGPARNEPGEITRLVAMQRDVTERRRMEEELRRSEEEFRSLFELSAIGMAQVGPDGRYLRVNRKLCQMLGYSEQELLQLTLHEVTHPEDREQSAAKLSSSFNDGSEEYFIEKRYVRKDGAIIRTLTNWTIVRDAEGRPLRTVANIQDITARKQAEETLRANEAQLRAILDNSTAVIFVKDLAGRYLRINHWYEVLHGVTEAEIKGKTDYDMHSKEIADAVRANDQEVIAANAPLQFEERVATTDGLRHFISVKFPLYAEGGRPYAVCGIATDITERKQAEMALQESKERLQLALEAADVGTWRANLKTGLDTRDAALSRILGEPEEAVVVPVSDWFERIHPDDAAKAQKSWEQALRTGLFDEETRMLKPDGEVIWVRDHGRIFYDSAGEPLYATGAVADITEHKQAEEALQKSEERLWRVTEATQDVLWEIDPRTRRLWWSERARPLFGFHAAEYEIELEDWYDRIHPEDVDRVKAQFEQFLRNDTADWIDEYRFRRADGAYIYILDRGRKFRIENGEPSLISGAMSDITERRRAEEALQLSEERLNMALQAVNIGMLDWDIRANALVWSERLSTMFGLLPGRTSGAYEDWRERVHPEDLPACEANIRETLEQRLTRWQAEYRIVRGDTGEVRWIDTQSRIFYDDQGWPVRAIAANMDITERKQAEEAVRESEARLRQIADAMPQIVYTCGPNGMADFLNQRGQEYLGVSLEQSIESAWREALHPDDRERTRRQWVEAVKTEQPFEIEYRLRRKDRQYRWLLSRAVPLRNEQKQIIKWIGTSTDIHDRKRAEAEREEVLAREQAAREASEAANRAKDEFLTLVSHELRSPLTAILGYANLLRQGPLDAQKVKQAVDVIERSGKTQVQLIDDLLDTARIISGKLKLYVGLVDLAVVINEAVQTIYPAANAKNISLQADLPSGIGQITGDPVRLQQVIWNLLSNAVKFTPLGGRVEVRLERIDPHICITVSDTGKGISPDFLPYVFDRFRQADASGARRYGGLGLGLALVKYLVELHGGTVEAASAGEGQGTTFKVTLPVRAVTALPGEAGGSPVTAPSPEEAAMLAGMRALVVDDESEARELVKMALAQYGADVVTAGSAAEAYALITSAPARERPEVIVTDLSMPDEDGYSLLRRVREWERKRGLYVPAVALTAYGRVEDRVRALMAGFQTHVAKPIEPAELAAVIKSLVRRPD